MKKLIKKTTTAVLVMLMMALGTATVGAHEAVDMTRSDCSLTITAHYGGTPVPGGTMTLYRVGDVIANGGDFSFSWKSALHCTSAMDNLESAKTADTVMDCVNKQGIPGTTVNVDSSGKASFTHLGVGLYLVEQKNAAHGYTAMKPFLISLPQWEDDHYVYAVTTLAKAETEKVPGPPPEPRTPPEPNTPPPNTPPKLKELPPPPVPLSKLPQTGQLNWPVPVMTVIGMTLMLIGYASKRERKYNR